MGSRERRGKVASYVDARSRGRDGPALQLDHLFFGDVHRPRGVEPARASGFHHEGAWPYARATEITRPADARGVYEARVQVFDASSRRWVAKSTLSTFFPRTWSGERVMREIRSAYRNARPSPYDAFVLEGRSRSGVRIQMVMRDGAIVTAYPIHMSRE